MFSLILQIELHSKLHFYLFRFSLLASRFLTLFNLKVTNERFVLSAGGASGFSRDILANKASQQQFFPQPLESSSCVAVKTSQNTSSQGSVLSNAFTKELSKYQIT
jgi:hypothetical protein